MRRGILWGSFRPRAAGRPRSEAAIQKAVLLRNQTDDLGKQIGHCFRSAGCILENVDKNEKLSPLYGDAYHALNRQHQTLFGLNGRRVVN